MTHPLPVKFQVLNKYINKLKGEKLKISKRKEIKKDEFRKNKDTRHPAYIYARVGNDYKFIGLTHSPITDNVKNIKLEKNPNPADKKDAYFRPKSEIAKTNKFKKKENGWFFSKIDKEKINRYKK